MRTQPASPLGQPMLPPRNRCLNLFAASWKKPNTALSPRSTALSFRQRLTAPLSGAKAKRLLRHGGGVATSLFFSRPDANISVAVHWPYLEHADLVGLEPRFLAKPSAGRPFIPHCTSPERRHPINARPRGGPPENPGPALAGTVAGARKTRFGPRYAVRTLDLESGSPRFSALVLRSLILVLIKSHNWPKAGELLNLGITAFPACADFPYLQAVCFLQQKTAVKAVRFLEMALNCTGREFVGSGGESSYRARYLLGLICDSVGQQEKAVNYWLPGAIEWPAFVPSVRALTQQRFPRGLARWLHQPLAEMVRREPQHLEVFVNFLF